MCEYCEKKKDLVNSYELSKKNDNYHGIDASIDGNIVYITASADVYEPGGYEEITFRINYCPMCGRKIVEEQDNE